MEYLQENLMPSRHGARGMENKGMEAKFNLKRGDVHFKDKGIKVPGQRKDNIPSPMT